MEHISNVSFLRTLPNMQYSQCQIQCRSLNGSSFLTITPTPLKFVALERTVLLDVTDEISLTLEDNC
jgi:hypothetical protein